MKNSRFGSVLKEIKSLPVKETPVPSTGNIIEPFAAPYNKTGAIDTASTSFIPSQELENSGNSKFTYGRGLDTDFVTEDTEKKDKLCTPKKVTKANRLSKKKRAIALHLNPVQREKLDYLSQMSGKTIGEFMLEMIDSITI